MKPFNLTQPNRISVEFSRTPPSVKPVGFNSRYKLDWRRFSTVAKGEKPLTQQRPCLFTCSSRTPIRPDSVTCSGDVTLIFYHPRETRLSTEILPSAVIYCIII